MVKAKLKSVMGQVSHVAEVYGGFLVFITTRNVITTSPSIKLFISKPTGWREALQELGVWSKDTTQWAQPGESSKTARPVYYVSKYYT